MSPSASSSCSFICTISVEAISGGARIPKS
jgi:hypothetical protein